MASHPIYTFKATLLNSKIPIWREFEVMNHITMARLAYILMTMFEMKASHLYQMRVPWRENLKRHMQGRLPQAELEVISQQFPQFILFQPLAIFDSDFITADSMDAPEVKFKDFINTAGDQLILEYDFGTSWEVALELIDIRTDKTLPGKELPRVLKGEGFGIIEDYPDLDYLQEVFNTKGPEYKELSEWMDTEELDLSHFDREDMNYRLKKIPRIYQDIYEKNLSPTKPSLKILNREYL